VPVWLPVPVELLEPVPVALDDGVPVWLPVPVELLEPVSEGLVVLATTGGTHVADASAAISPSLRTVA